MSDDRKHMRCPRCDCRTLHVAVHTMYRMVDGEFTGEITTDGPDENLMPTDIVLCSNDGNDAACDWRGTVSEVLERSKRDLSLPIFHIGYCVSLEGEVEVSAATNEDAREKFDELGVEEWIARHKEVVYGERYDVERKTEVSRSGHQVASFVTEVEKCPKCGETGYTDPKECSYCQQEREDDGQD